jgi:hypothetical protein
VIRWKAYTVTSDLRFNALTRDHGRSHPVSV